MKSRNVFNYAAGTVLLFGFIAAFLAACGNADTDRLHPVLKDGKWGYIDYQGKIVIEPQFRKAHDFSDGLALVFVNPSGQSEDGKFGFIDRTGKLVIESQFQSSAFFPSAYEQKNLEDSGFPGGFRLALANDKKIICLDKTGKTVFELDSKQMPHGGFSDGLLLVRASKEDLSANYNFLDTSGKVAFKGDFAFADPFRDGIARVSEAGGESYIDKTGKTVFAGKYEKGLAFSEGLSNFGDSGKFGFVDKTGKVVIEPKFDAAGDFHEGLAAVRKGAFWGYIDKTGKWAIEPKLSSVTTPNDFSEGAILIFADGKYQIIDTSGKTIASLDSAIGSEPSTGSVVGKFQGGLARIVYTFADDEIRVIYVNKKGEVVWNEKGKVAESKK